MNDPSPPVSSSRSYSGPLVSLVVARLKEFFREPEAVFWVYGFPIVMMMVLGLAFRSQPVERIRVDVQSGPGAEQVKQTLSERSKKELEFVVAINDPDVCRRRLRTGKTDLVVAVQEQASGPAYQFTLDKTRAESRLAKIAVDAALGHAAGRQEVAVTLPDKEMTEPGSRYIDFLVPGLLGMSLMGGGLWGVGFVIVDMRIRKLMKRYLATPMKRRDFLLGVMISRLLFMVPEVLLMLWFGWCFFGVTVQGSLAAVMLLVLLGAFTFAGIGLLVASRAKTVETVTGLMNLVMLPMWLLSGIFFSPDRFPDAWQPLIKALPLTPLINALRSVMLEGATLASQWAEIGILAAYGIVTFVVALKIFRWN